MVRQSGVFSFLRVYLQQAVNGLHGLKMPVEKLQKPLHGGGFPFAPHQKIDNSVRWALI